MPYEMSLSPLLNPARRVNALFLAFRFNTQPRGVRVSDSRTWSNNDKS